MASLNVYADRSVFIDSSSPTTNFDSAPQIDVGEAVGSSELRRGYIDFSLLGQYPNQLTGAIIDAAVLNIYDSGSDLTDNARTINVAQVKLDWVETEITWNVRKTATNWNTAGGSNASDRTSAIGTLSLPNPPVSGYKQITLTAAEIQKWITGEIVDNGITLYMDTETNDMHRFAGSGEANPPYIALTYTPKSSFLQMF